MTERAADSNSEQLRQLMVDRIVDPAITRVIAKLADDQRQNLIEALEQGDQIPASLVLIFIHALTELPIGAKDTVTAVQAPETKERLITLETLRRSLADIFKKREKDPDANLRTRVRKELYGPSLEELGDVLWTEIDEKRVARMVIKSVVRGDTLNNFFRTNIRSMVPEGYVMTPEELSLFKDYLFARLQARFEAFKSGQDLRHLKKLYTSQALRKALKESLELFKGDPRKDELESLEEKLRGIAH